MRYLSDEWLAAADTAIREASPTAPDIRLTIDQHIQGRVDYRVVIGRDAAGVTTLTGDELAGDAAFTQTEETARSVARGETDAHQAFLLGRIRFEGDIDVLIERRDALLWLEEVLAPLMAVTTF